MSAKITDKAGHPTKGRVLLVDDDVDLAEALEEILESLDYETRLALNAASALEAAQTFLPEIALIDNRLGLDSGVELLAKLKEDRPETICLIMTAYAEVGSAIEALRHGAYDYLQKPLNPREVLATLERCFEMIRLQREKDEAVEALRAAKNEAEASSLAKTEFLKTISHELRTPLNAIIGFSDVLIGQAFGSLGSNRYVEYAENIRDNGTQLLNVIDNVIDIVKLDTHNLELAEDSVRLEQIVDRVVEEISLLAREAGLTFSVDQPSPGPYIIADAPKLKQILLNLLHNAVKFTNTPGHVGLRIGLDGEGDLTFEIHDSGIGIPEDKVALVTCPFSRIDNRLNRAHEGMGLGLPLAIALVELHDGHFTLESELGKGTTARFTLPAERIIDGAPGPDTAGAWRPDEAADDPRLENLPETLPMSEERNAS